MFVFGIPADMAVFDNFRTGILTVKTYIALEQTDF